MRDRKIELYTNRCILYIQVGLELRELLASVDRLIPLFPASTHRQVEMAHKVLSKDMSDLVNSMKLAQKYNNTTVEADYRK